MADTGRSGAVGIRQKYNAGRQPVSTRPKVTPATSQSSQAKQGSSISTSYKEFAGKDEYGYVKQRTGGPTSNQGVVGSTDEASRPKTGHGHRREKPHPTQTQSSSQHHMTGANVRKQNAPTRTSQSNQKVVPQSTSRTTAQSKTNILTLNDEKPTQHVTQKSNVPLATPMQGQGSQFPRKRSQDSTGQGHEGGQFPRKMSQDSTGQGGQFPRKMSQDSTGQGAQFPRKMSQESVGQGGQFSRKISEDSTGGQLSRKMSQDSTFSEPYVPQDLQEQSWDMREVNRQDFTESMESDPANNTEIDGRPRTSRGKRCPAPAEFEAQFEPPVPPAFTEEVPERPKTSHGRRQRQDQSMDYQEAYSSQMIYQTGPIAPSPPPYPQPAKRQTSASRRQSSASRKSSIETNPDIGDILQGMPDVRPTSAALQKYKRLPSIGDKTASDRLIGINTEMRRMSLENAPQPAQVAAVKQQLHRHYTPPQVLTLADSDVLIMEQINTPPAQNPSPIPGEPEEGEKRVLLAIRLPSGERIQRYFRLSECLNVVLKFAEQIAEKSFAGYSLVCSMPKQVFKDLSVEIKDTKLQDRTVLLLQAPD